MIKRTIFFTEQEVEEWICDWKPVSKKFKDLTGYRQGELTVIKLHKRIKPHTHWFVKCDCGNIFSISTNNLSSGRQRCSECSFSRVAEKKNTVDVDGRMKDIISKFPSITLVEKLPTRKWKFHCSSCNTEFREYSLELLKPEYEATSCRCDNGKKFTQWTTKLREEQIHERCNLLGLNFDGWESEEGYKNNCSRIFLSCKKEHKWSSNINNFLGNGMYGCPDCYEDRKGKTLSHGLEKFITDGTSVHNGQFDYSEYEYKCSRTPSKVTCKVCKGSFKVSYDNHVNKKRGCPSCKGKNQEHAYLVLVQDGDLPLALKYGIARQTSKRFDEHSKACIFETSLISNWKFPDSISCKAAELEVKQNVKGSVLTVQEFPSGNTETTHVFNLEYIESVYSKHGGVKVYE